jgi:hypothetical protein
MGIPNEDLDKTLILRPAAGVAPGLPRSWRMSALLALVGAGGVLVIGGLSLWLLLDPFRTAPPPPAPAPVRVAEPAIPAIPILVATEAQVAIHNAERLTVFRFADNPRILILDYPNLREQGLALNRLAAFVEKAGLPKDRVLDDGDLAAEIARSGETIDSYYFGHDYAVRDVMRFFGAADRDAIRLSASEEMLRTLILQERLADPGPASAIITVPRVDGTVVDAFTRRIILRHELSHGEFFTNPVYSAYVHRAWHEILSAEERDAFQRFLAGQNYDTGNLDLVVNEMQAFLAFTPDERYASPETLGLTSEGLKNLRARFVAGMPQGWLRMLAAAPLP